MSNYHPAYKLTEIPSHLTPSYKGMAELFSRRSFEHLGTNALSWKLSDASLFQAVTTAVIEQHHSLDAPDFEYPASSVDTVITVRR